MIGWAVVIAKPNSESVAVVNLERQGFNCYFPRYRECKAKKVVVKPLFPRYLFVHIDNFWYSIRGTRGVSSLLMNEEGPAKISESIITAIKSREDQEGFVIVSSKDTREEKFIKGQPVKTLEGPFAGLSMIYEGMSANDRVCVLIDMLGRKVSATVKENGLVAA